MGVRKNAKFLTATERENFVKACVLMHADIVNPAAPVVDRYSRWDESVANHRMIQNANSPGGNNINFGHGGLGAFSFLSWHRYFLFRFELQLQSYVPGVMLPYWDWTDPAPLMTPTFLGPDGAAATNVVSSGYFAASAPGTPGNPTPAPPWWPATLAGWNLANGFGALSGPLTRNLSAPGSLPSVSDLQTTLARTTYSSFQNMIESGSGLPSGNQMHNGIHGWFGNGSSHMATLTGSPFDPFFYLHHCNIDRLWAMWQADGHATTYPAAGANNQHGPNDIMFPWTGGAPGYSSNLSFGVIVMPDFAALGAQRNVDTLDHRALGYTYDTLAVIGLGLDRTGSMTGLTPDPMTGVGTVTKWEAAKRGVSAFLQDCETVQSSAAIYVTAGVKTFRSLAGNEFAAVFPGVPYGLVKNGTPYSKGTFDGAVAAMSPGGGTPLADALQDVQDTLVAPPFSGLPPDEQRYLAMLTDGMLTSGSPLASIPDGAFANTGVFAMGFGTAADVDYATLAALVAKGRNLGFTQVFHGENAGTIDKFFSNALARAIGFTTVFDPVLELFAGEHVHLDFTATSADFDFLVTAQGMDFEDPNWAYQLVGPDGVVAYSDGLSHSHGGAAPHGARRPHVTAKRADGRLSLVLQRDGADASCWVGGWQLMVAYRARDLSSMVMVDLGELLVPVAAGPVRGPRYARLLQNAERRPATRSFISKPRHRLDVRPGGTNNDGAQSCSVVVNVYARTHLRVELRPSLELVDPGSTWE
ncbi:MAG TPA: tyrosinase family protein, partial [Planctomycetia bacterium]|nr:tyrosinase family protein [Planctomycetia bacterium]